MHKILFTFLFVLCRLFSFGQSVQTFNDSWEFAKDIDSIFISKLFDKNQDIKWTKVRLPHTANIEPIQKVKQQWQGTCYYRKKFTIPSSDKGRHIAVKFDAAMQVADVYLNGKHVFKHLGGYLPFYIDISDQVLFDEENTILVRLNNEDNSLVPPGKPIKKLDFNYYSGIYRDAWLIKKEKLYITDAVAANQIAGGGVFVSYKDITTPSATVLIKTDVKNDTQSDVLAELKVSLADHTGKILKTSSSEGNKVSAGTSTAIQQEMVLKTPTFWSPENPYLYTLTVELVHDGKVVDKQMVKTGVKTVRITKDGFYLNGQRLVIRGTNRHQDYPYLGNAVSDNGQYRDAYKIKMAGFNFVRSSHYPQSPAFLDACDALGLMVMDAIPGWQFVGNDVFQENSFQDIRDMIRRDRNHASIVMWEASLNESGMSKKYMEKAHSIVHEELPMQGIYSAGWLNEVYDVFIPARAHTKAPDYWKKYDEERPLFIAEYGDWEYYAQNAGFNQTAFKDLKEEERTSRQLRGFGEKRMLQQARNYQESHNDNLYNPHLGDANWLMFDYNRGYANDIESSGIMDIVRLPKFAFYFYESQKDPILIGDNVFNKPMLFIANYWQPNSSTDVRIFSNCEEVELFLNGKSLGRQKPDTDMYSTNLKHPPFTFTVGSFKAGTLRALGYINKKKVIETKQRTPEAPIGIRLRVDYSGKELVARTNDAVFVYAEVIDAKGTVVPDYSGKIDFSVNGDAEIIGQNSPNAEAGIATILVRAGLKPGLIGIVASSNDLKTGNLKIEAK